SPGVVDAGAPHDVVAFVLQEEALGGEVEAEAASDEDDDRGAVVVGDPGVALLACWVDAPLDLHVVGGADVVGVLDEVTDEPASAGGAFGVGVACVPVVRHQVSSVIGGVTTRPLVSRSA